jgi:hypothetical protein
VSASGSSWTWTWTSTSTSTPRRLVIVVVMVVVVVVVGAVVLRRARLDCREVRTMPHAAFLQPIRRRVACVVLALAAAASGGCYSSTSDDSVVEDASADEAAVDESGADDAAVDDSGPVDPCAGETCSGHGICVVTGGVPYCVCEGGYFPFGLNCVHIDDCGDLIVNPGEECDGDTRACGDCGTQSCRPDCLWGDCVDPGMTCDYCAADVCYNELVESTPGCGCASGICGSCTLAGGSYDVSCGDGGLCRYFVHEPGYGCHCP